MSLRFKKLNLRCQTLQGLFACEIAFADGLTLVRASNNMGKSTCVQAIVYALGLERMLSPVATIPLPHVMTSFIDTPQGKVDVVESEVYLEIENGAGVVLEITRSVKGPKDFRLINTVEVTNGTRIHADYYVRDPGAAQHEKGFAKKLSEFMGWHVPDVLRFNGSTCPLYTEAIFPLFFVEQKHGWSGIQSNLPTYFGIKEVSKRAIEFVLKLDVQDFSIELDAVRQAERDLNTKWRAIFTAFESKLGELSGRIVGLPEEPTSIWPPAGKVEGQHFESGEWIPIETAVLRSKAELDGLTSRPVPLVGAIQQQMRDQLEVTSQRVIEMEVLAAALSNRSQHLASDQEAVRERLISLNQDLKRNQDAEKLRAYGSTLKLDMVSNTCPTCRQYMDDTLLTQDVGSRTMPIESNVEFVKNQIKLFESLSEGIRKDSAQTNLEMNALRGELQEGRVRLRSLKEALIQPGDTPSVEELQQRITLEGKVEKLRGMSLTVTEAEVEFSELASEYKEILVRKDAVPKGGVSRLDKDKMSWLEKSVREQLKSYGFSSVEDVTDIEISSDTYRPVHDGFDLGFDISASDGIRLMWAYLNALLELSSEFETNHPGFLLLDEPRQQSADRVSLERLLLRVAEAGRRGHQVICFTSEPLSDLASVTQHGGVSVQEFRGRVITPSP